MTRAATIDTDRVRVVVTSFDYRREIEVPADFINEMITSNAYREDETAELPTKLLSFFRESEVTLPEYPMLTKTEGTWVVHSVPRFG